MDDDLQQLFSSAETGHPEAQYELGRCYYKGLGVCRDFGEARKWFVRSARQGHTNSLFMVGLIYHLGKGLRRCNPILAHAWFSLAAGQGCQRSDKEIGRLESLWKWAMSPSNLAKARAMAADWEAKFRRRTDVSNIKAG